MAVGAAPGILVGVGVGTAASAAIEPAVELPRQEAWKASPHRELDPATMARLFAQGAVSLDAVHEAGLREGYGTDKTDALAYLAQTVPPVAEALNLWRRGLISDALWDHVLVKTGLDARYLAALGELKDSEPLDPSVVATAVQRGLLPNEGILPVGPPSGAGVVEPMPTVALDPFEEAAKSGVNKDRLKVQARLVGLPPAPGELLQLVNRGIIEQVDYFRGVAEGNTRNEWAEVLLQLRHPVLSGVQYAGLWLRNWLTEAQAKKGGSLQGYSPEQMDLLYKLQGRPPSPTQMWTMWAREAPGPFGGLFDFEDFSDGIRRSNIRTEYVDPLWAIRWNYPSLFQMRQLTQSGIMPPERARAILKNQRYEPQDIELMVTGWTGAGGARAKGLTAAALLDEYEGGFLDQGTLLADLEALGYTPESAQMEAHLADARRVKKAKDQTIEAIRKSFLGHDIQRGDAEGRLTDAGMSAEAVGSLLGQWDRQAALERKTLTPTQIVRAYSRSVISRAEALTELQAEGYTPEAAAILLDTPAGGTVPA